MSALLNASVETLLMVFISGFFACSLGLFFAIILYCSAPQRLLECRALHLSLGLIINITRSIPYVIFMIAIIPFTRWLVGTPIGTSAAMVPLTLAAIPFYARIAESALNEVSTGLIEAVTAMGATPFQIIRCVLIPEAMPGLVRGATITAIALVGYSAMAGVVGGGGLGSLAYHYGYQRFNAEVMFTTTAILVVFVQALQWMGDRLAARLTKGS